MTSHLDEPIRVRHPLDQHPSDHADIVQHIILAKLYLLLIFHVDCEEFDQRPGYPWIIRVHEPNSIFNQGLENFRQVLLLLQSEYFISFELVLRSSNFDAPLAQLADRRGNTLKQLLLDFEVIIIDVVNVDILCLELEGLYHLDEIQLQNKIEFLVLVHALANHCRNAVERSISQAQFNRL